MSAKKRVGLIFGGRSGEHAVSLMSARSVLAALDPAKYVVTPIGIAENGHWHTGPAVLEALEARSFTEQPRCAILGEPGHGCLYSWRLGGALESLGELDVIFPLVHGSYGEDGTLQGLLEMADMAYVGAGVLASSVAMDKALFKQLMRAHHLPVLESTLLLSTEFAADQASALGRAEAVALYPLFVKPANLGSSVGVSKCRNRSDLLEGVLDALRYDRRVIVERGLEAREIEVSVLGNEDVEASVPGEIIPSDEFYSYRAKYIDDASQLLIPAEIEIEQADEIRRIAIEAFRAVDGAGMARVDFLLEKGGGHIYLNELNTIPGFTKISMYPKLWEASGLPYPQLLDRLIDLALARQQQKAGLVRTYEAGHDA
jgi:D-alanine-D-alanine ligase